MEKKIKQAKIFKVFQLNKIINEKKQHFNDKNDDMGDHSHRS